MATPDATAVETRPTQPDPMSIFDLAAFHATPLQRKPFDHLVVPGFIRPDALAATTASVALASQRGWRLLPPLPAVFACMHLAYGAGFLAGALGLAAAGTRRRRRADAHQNTGATG